jgi:hypothetical protein
MKYPEAGRRVPQRLELVFADAEFHKLCTRGSGRIIRIAFQVACIGRTVTVAVKFSELMDAFEFVSVAGPFDNRAYVDLITGKIYLVSDELELEEELPDDLEESDRYLAVPGKNELDLGSPLVERFVRERLPADAEEVSAFFRRKGAYSRLKILLADRGVLQQWYEFEQVETSTALRAWCQENEIELADSGGTQARG